MSLVDVGECVLRKIITMRFLDVKDIQDWAGAPDGRYNLPLLVRKLITATIGINNIQNIEFAYGEEVQTGGFDGELSASKEGLFVPKGESVWEFGSTKSSKKGKADSDYEKRTTNPLHKTPANTTYINVNGYKYRDKNKWSRERTEEGIWKGVRYFDAVDIDQWLETAPTVELWLAERLSKPTLGIYSLERYWNLWSKEDSLQIVPELLLGDSRKKEIEIVKSFSTNESSSLFVKSVTIDESVAFILAVYKQFEDESKVVVIDNQESFSKFIRINQPLIIIAKFRIESISMSEAIANGHKLIIPVSPAEDSKIENTIKLPIISRATLENGLKLMNQDSEQISFLVRESGRNISVLKKLLGFSRVNRNSNVKAEYILPLLLLGKFREDFEGDIEVVEELCGMSIEEYLRRLKEIQIFENSPIYRIGKEWRLVSITDAFLSYGRYLSENDFDKLETISAKVLTEKAYRYSVPAEERGSIIYNRNNRPRFSGSLKEGLCSVLIVLAVFGERYDLESGAKLQLKVNRIVNEILKNELVVWRSLSRNLMLLAEAAPTVFLDNLERILDNQTFADFFEEQDSGLFGKNNDLAPLLWCLDILAWFPEYLLRVSIALCRIIEISPEKFPTANIPQENLRNIYRAWYPQTNTSAVNRKKILEKLSNKYPRVIFDLLYGLSRGRRDSASHTVRPYWRSFSELREIEVDFKEARETTDFYVDTIFKLSENDPHKLISLIDLMESLNKEKLLEALNLLKEYTGFTTVEKDEIYHKFRRLIGHQRSFPNARWSIPNDILDEIEKVAVFFKPNDAIRANRYLFEEISPMLIEGKTRGDFDKFLKIIELKRIKFIETVLENFGLEKINELVSESNNPRLYGIILAQMDRINEEEIQKVYEQFYCDDEKTQNFVIGFVDAYARKTGLSFQIDKLKELIQTGLSTAKCIMFLNALPQGIELWQKIDEFENDDIEQLYWESKVNHIGVTSKAGLDFALGKLLEYGNSIVYLNTLGWFCFNYKNGITSDEILTALEKISLQNTKGSATLDDYFFKNIIEVLNGRNDFEVERAAKIEIKFMWLHKELNYPPKNLHILMTQRPEEYFSAIDSISFSDSEKIQEEEKERIGNSENYWRRRKITQFILESINLVSCFTIGEEIDLSALKKWVTALRELGIENNKITSVDNYIGKLLAKHPIDLQKGKGYPNWICGIIEEISTREIKSSFRTQIFNNLGFTTRGPYSGGAIERFRADFFETQYEECKIIYPNVAEIFRNLRDDYLIQAKDEDAEAFRNSLE